MRNRMTMTALAVYLASALPAGAYIRAEVPSAAELERIADDMSAIQATADAEGRALTAEEAAAIDRLYARFNTAEVALRAAAARHGDDPAPGAAQRPGRKTSPAAPGAMIAGTPINALPAPSDGIALGGAALPPGIVGRRYDDLFARATRRSPVDALSPVEFLRNMALGINDPRMIRAAQSEGVGEAGGFEVPVQLVKAIFDAALSQEQVRPRCTVYPITSNAIVIPQANAFDRSSNVAGVRSQWVGEGGTIDVQTGSLKALSMKTSKLVSMVKLSNELLEDSLSAGQIFADIMAAAMSYDLDGAYLTGTGAGMPKGVLNSTSIITQDAESAQTADTLLFANIAGMWSRLHPACQANAVWFVAPGAVPQLLTMAFDPAADSKTPIFTVGGTAASPMMTLMGRPVIVSEHLPPLGDLGDVLLVDLSKYVIVIRGGMALDKSAHAAFTTDESLWRLRFRTDGHALWPAAVTPRGGGPTLSWAVTLAAR